jgi:CubicO group peptidase (beta-lactamase class C family)
MRADALALIADHARTAMERDRLPGIVYGVVEGGAVVHTAGFGTTRAGTVSRPDEHTLFRIASMTKSFTAAAVLLARDAGLVVLDDPVGRYVPELAGLRGPTRDSPVITLRHLLTMSGGFATDDAWADRHLDMSTSHFDALLRDGTHFAYAPGVAYCYSNLGYAALGRVVANVYGRSCQQVVADRLLEPLDMHDTGWDAEQPADRRRAHGHRVLDGEWLAEPALADGQLAPMGGLWSTVVDLGRWVAFLADAFPPRDDSDDAPLCRASRREMQQVARLMPSSGPASSGYAMGLRVSIHPGIGRTVHHSGGLPGFGSNMRWMPSRGVGVIALANLTYADMAAFTEKAVELLHGADALPPRYEVHAPLVHDAGAALVGLLASWDDERAGALFADNVLLDDDTAHRRANAAALVARIGGLRLVRVEPDSAATGTAVVEGERGTARISFALSPQHPPRLQSYDVDHSG